jgi:hypothetical protein
MQAGQVNPVPPATQPPRADIGLVPHRQQQRSHRLPCRRGQAALDAAHGGLCRARPPRERTLAETEPLAVLPDDATGIRDI